MHASLKSECSGQTQIIKLFTTHGCVYAGWLNGTYLCNAHPHQIMTQISQYTVSFSLGWGHDIKCYWLGLDIKNWEWG